jgi:hypothetical protein
MREVGDGRFVVTFASGGGGDETESATIEAPDLQAAITAAQARWPELDFRPWREGDDVADDVVAVSP